MALIDVSACGGDCYKVLIAVAELVAGIVNSEVTNVLPRSHVELLLELPFKGAH